MSRVAVLQHFWPEHAGFFSSTLEEVGHEVMIIKVFNGEMVPSPGDFDALLVLGGPMSVHDDAEYPWLAEERNLLKALIREDRPVLGICLGAQQIARAAGARVYASGPKEIGLFHIELTPEAAGDRVFAPFNNPQEVFQWHGETFDLPTGAVQLARSERYEQQAFRIGRRVYGMQFHLEFTQDIVENLRGACAAELQELPPEDSLDHHDPRLMTALVDQNELASRVIRCWADLFN